MAGFRAPLFAIGLSAAAAVAPTPGFSSPLFLLGLATTPAVTPVPEVDLLGGGPDPWADDDDEILSVIMAYMAVRNV